MYSILFYRYACNNYNTIKELSMFRIKTCVYTVNNRGYTTLIRKLKKKKNCNLNLSCVTNLIHITYWVDFYIHI